jgi:hypothetical protein
MTSILEGLTGAEGTVEEETDFQGRKLLETAAHELTIKMAFIGKSTAGAPFVQFQLEDAAETELREIIYIGNRAGKLFYEKNGKTFDMPGLQTVNAICRNVAEKTLLELDTKILTIDLWQKGENGAKGGVQPVDVEALPQLIDQKIHCAVEKQLADKTVKTDAKDSKGKAIYAPTGQTFEKNELVKVLNNKGLTGPEAKQGETEPKWLVAWLAKNEGMTIDRTDKTTPVHSGNNVSGQATDTQPTQSLFAAKS